MTHGGSVCHLLVLPIFHRNKPIPKEQKLKPRWLKLQSCHVLIDIGIQSIKTAYMIYIKQHVRNNTNAKKKKEKENVFCSRKVDLLNGTLSLQVHPGHVMKHILSMSFPSKYPLAPCPVCLEPSPSAHLSFCMLYLGDLIYHPSSMIITLVMTHQPVLSRPVT